MSNNTFYLIIESATENSFVILGNSGKPVDTLVLENTQNHLLIAKIQGFLQKNSVDLSSLSFLAIGLGPGSYTGMRSAAAIGAALSYGQEIPLCGFSSLRAYIPPKGVDHFYAITDAKSGGIYLLEGCVEKEAILYPAAPFILSKEKAMTFLKGSYLVTPHTEKLRDFFPDSTIITASFDPGHLSALCYDLFLKKKFIGLGELELSYLAE